MLRLLTTSFLSCTEGHVTPTVRTPNFPGWLLSYQCPWLLPKATSTVLGTVATCGLASHPFWEGQMPSVSIYLLLSPSLSGHQLSLCLSEQVIRTVSLPSNKHFLPEARKPDNQA